MKPLSKIVLATLVFTLNMRSLAHTLAETNEIVRIMLGAATAFDDNPGGRHLRRKRNFLKQSEFFNSAYFGHGWTSDGLRAAFDYYLAHMHEGDYSCGSETTPYWPAMAVAQCWNMNYTNAVPAIRLLTFNATYPWKYRMVAARAAIELGEVNDAATTFVDSIMTNTERCVRMERFMACSAYCKQILAFEATNEYQVLSRDHALAMLYRNRKIDWENAFGLDDLFCQCTGGFSMSLNRFELATNTLSSVDCQQATRDHFISVTNQLLSSGQPLQWISIGTEGD